MILTYLLGTLRRRPRSSHPAGPPRGSNAPAGALRGHLTAQDGFGLIEVLISAVLVAVISIATFTGFDASNRATASQRARAQADQLAQQDEERLRGMQISQISSLSETRTVKYLNAGNKVEYTIKSSGEYIADTTGTESCAKEAQTASYVKTVSEVSSPLLRGQAVVETGIITPPVGGELLVQVFDGNGEAVSGMTVTATGPSPSTASLTATTGTKGCVIFSSLTAGEYKVTTYQAGYVDKDGNSEPPESQRVVTVTSGTTAKKSFEFARAGGLKVSFETPGLGGSEGDSFVAFNPNMTLPSYKSFGTPGTYASSINTGLKLFPFGKAGPPSTGNYTVYAGTCPGDQPALPGEGVHVPEGEYATYTVVLPAVNIKVYSGKGTAEGTLTKFSGTFKDEGSECKNQVHAFSTTTATNGELHKSMPFGKFSLCIASNEAIGSPARYRRFRGAAITNNSSGGTALQSIFLSAAGSEENKSKLECP